MPKRFGRRLGRNEKPEVGHLDRYLQYLPATGIGKWGAWGGTSNERLNVEAMQVQASMEGTVKYQIWVRHQNINLITIKVTHKLHIL